MARHGSPRLQMLALLTVTGGSGFAASYALLHLGVRSMAVRYPIAVLFAYACFLLVLRLWLATMMRRGDRSRGDFDLDVLDVIPGGGGGGGGGSVRGPAGFGGGGGFTGGGAGGSWAGPAAPMASPGSGPRMQGFTGGGASRGSSGGFKLGLPSLDLDAIREC